MKDILVKFLTEQLEMSGVRDNYPLEEIEQRVNKFIERENLIEVE